jgi:non-specific serine/threonine protein kinase
MSFYLSRESVSEWAGHSTFVAGRRLWEQGAVRKLDLSGELIRADIMHANRITHTRFKLYPDGSIDTKCPCRITQEQGMVCIHVIAAGFQIAWLTEDPVLERRKRIAARRERNEAQGSREPDYIPRMAVPEGKAAGTQLRLRIEVAWQEQLARKQAIEITCYAVSDDTKRRLDRLTSPAPLELSPADLKLLYIIEDLYGRRCTPGTLHLGATDFCGLLTELSESQARISILGQPGTMPVRSDPLIPVITGRKNLQTGTCRLSHQVELDAPVGYVISRHRVWAYSATSGFFPVEAVLPEPMHPLYHQPAIEMSRTRVVALISHELPALEDEFLVDCDLSPDAFEICEGTPQFEVELSGSPELLATRVLYRYGDSRVPADCPDSTPPQCIPVPGQPFAYTTRNKTQEAAGLSALAEVLRAEAPYGRFRDVHGAEASMRRVTEVAAFGKRENWTVKHTGIIGNYVNGAEWVVPAITLDPSTEAGWFNLTIGYTLTDGTRIPESVVEDALHANRSLIEIDGQTALIDVSQTRRVDTFCSEVSDMTADGLSRVSDIHAGYLTASLGDMTQVTFDAPPEWYEHASRQSGQLELEDVELNDFLEKTLRPYQRDGVRWLRFLEAAGYSGILADEMGLGKTIQTLAWIQLKRLSSAAEHRPSIVVCPTSLVENWAAEARRFTPHLRCHMVRGARRHAEWHRIMESDLIITSYSLLRRDIERYQDIYFSIAVLDEAQHIKNHSTLNAQAAKQVRAAHRLVLTGTPVENSVYDLWSIMDYLMPRYLGTHAQFRERVERPVGAGGKLAGQALLRLRRKLQPFMLRRLKAAVAKDLPPKIERIAVCRLSHEQERLYARLEDAYRNQLHDIIPSQGSGNSQFTVLKTLLRLRQACCHPSLVLKDQSPCDAHRPDDAAARSGKVELFLELLNEAMDSGQRVLVFSQFVEMLKILRQTLEARGIRYSYLDGSTTNRQARVDEFNSNDQIPVFLVSLKAGGSGLNLTGASVVIHFDPWWNPAVEDQATDRAHRIGQERTVYSIKLVAKDTVEERVIDLQEKKRRLINAAVADQEAMVQSLTWEDIRSLLAL